VVLELRELETKAGASSPAFSFHPFQMVHEAKKHAIFSRLGCDRMRAFKNQAAVGLLAPFLKCHPQRVNTRLLPAFAAMLVFACCLSCPAKDTGEWLAESSGAKSITGDLTLYSELIKINLNPFPLQWVRNLTTAEVSAAFDADINAGGTGVLYRTTIPASKHFVHRNTLCGSDDTHWMATFVSGHTLQVAFFSGSETPDFTLEALRNSTDLCGTFSYTR
jgi:hypothetical protein